MNESKSPCIQSSLLGLLFLTSIKLSTYALNFSISLSSISSPFSLVGREGPITVFSTLLGPIDGPIEDFCSVGAYGFDFDYFSFISFSYSCSESSSISKSLSSSL